MWSDTKPPAKSAHTWLLLSALSLLLLLLASPARCTPKELVISYHVCADGQGCHVIDQVAYHDSHILLLTSTDYKKRLQVTKISIFVSFIWSSGYCKQAIGLRHICVLIALLQSIGSDS
ncbi:hypothetical protein BX661DRAFT_13084 [Kickxella alabastrina]|uniref:uncharacterized protein n=1 Tax=Kickxella alabastrina TaxID=61397 RepID=UPI00221F52D6|nr:uncharacterized protein BX661DRAFT_13084 [Kickxella alabastrina]KAI7828342.1 hypothetical protein BX661DRAFT_13084 [Kickxella alabastrina]